MKEVCLSKTDYSEEFKEKLVEQVVYYGQSAKAVAKKYGLANTHILSNWVNIHKKKLATGAVTLAPMERSKANDSAELKKRIRQLEKSLEKANVLIYGLNSMIDRAEKEHKLAIRKKDGTKQ